MSRTKPPEDCLAEVSYNWNCGTASTYNNGGCRGQLCRDAVAAYRSEQRAKAKFEAAHPSPKKKKT